MKYCVLMLGLLALLSAACKRSADIDLKDPVPTILGVTITPDNVQEYQDSIVFAVQYRDGDGDLGENTPDAKNLFLVDNRIQTTEQFRIRALAPQGAEVPITGTLRVVLRNTGITDGSASQSFNYTIYMKDRAGHESGHFLTSQVVVHQ